MTKQTETSWEERFDDLLYNEEIEYIDKRDRRLIENFISTELQKAREETKEEMRSMEYLKFVREESRLQAYEELESKLEEYDRLPTHLMKGCITISLLKQLITNLKNK